MKYPLRSRFIAELIGSMFLVMAAVSPIILFNDVLKSGIAIAVLADAIAVGFILFALIEIFGPISGAHFNPAVTIAMGLTQKLPFREIPNYIISQVIGGFFGAIFSHLMFYHEIPKLIEISENVRSGGNFLAEIFGTFILVLAIFLLIDHNSDKIGLIVGMLVGGELIATSSTMFANPQVTFARIFTHSAAGVRPIDGLIFIAMQLIGMGLAIIVWRSISEQNHATK